MGARCRSAYRHGRARWAVTALTRTHGGARRPGTAFVRRQWYGGGLLLGSAGRSGCAVLIGAHDAPQTILLRGSWRPADRDSRSDAPVPAGRQGEQHLEMLRDAHRLRGQMTGIGIGRLGQPLHAMHGEGVVQLMRADQNPDLHLVIGVSAQQRGVRIRGSAAPIKPPGYVTPRSDRPETASVCSAVAC